MAFVMSVYVLKIFKKHTCYVILQISMWGRQGKHYYSQFKFSAFLSQMAIGKRWKLFSKVSLPNDTVSSFLVCII